MRLVGLDYCDVHLDGGSYSASWLTDDEQEYGLWLQRSRMPDDAGFHHRWLFEYRGERRAPDCPPVVSGSQQEQELLARLDEFLREPKVTPTPIGTHCSLRRLLEMHGYIVRREPCSLKDRRSYLLAQQTWFAAARDHDASLRRER